MKPWVKEKLARVGELYPAERLEKSKGRWRAVQEGLSPLDRYPFTFYPAGFNYYNESFSKEDGLRAYLDAFIDRGFVEDDFIPAFFPGCHQGTIPAMLGATEIVVGNEHVNQRNLFVPEDIDNLPDPTIRPGTSAAHWLQMQRYYAEECEGALPVHVCDMQGPVDAAAQMYGYDNLFLLAYDDEDRFHKLLSKVSDAFCMLWEAQENVLGDLFVGTHLFGWNWVPTGHGASLSADSMAMVSGAFLSEYYAPHLDAIAKRLGKLSVHSCGNFTATVGALGAAESVRAVNASQLSLTELLSAGWPEEKMVILMEPVESAANVFALARQRHLRLDVSFTGLWAIGRDGIEIPLSEYDADLRAEILRRVEAVANAAAG